MLKSIVFAIITLSAANCYEFPVQPVQDVHSCTVAVHHLTDSLLDLAYGFEEHYFDPGAKRLIQVLYGVQEIITICANSSVSIKKYDQCINGLYPVLPLVGDLVDSIKNGYTQNIIEDSIKIGLVLTGGIALCVDISA